MNFISETTPPIVIASKLNSYIPEIPPDIASISPNISKELVKLIDKNVINVEQKSTYSTSRILSLNKNYSIWSVSQNETVSQSETVSQNVTSTVSQNETVGVSQNETKKLKKETKKETKDIHTKSDDFGSVCQSVFDFLAGTEADRILFAVYCGISAGMDGKPAGGFYLR